MALTSIKIELEFSESNGLMTTSFNGKDITPAGSGTLLVEEILEMPALLKFEFSGKQGQDTVLDEKGNIISDKYVKIKSMIIGHVPVNSNLLYSLCSYTRNGETVNDTFFGFNGELEIHIDSDDAILWHLENDNKFDI
jgi:hypothetical protein